MSCQLPAERPSNAAAMSAVYADLRRVARRLLAAERAGHTLESCDLVNQAFARVLHGASMRARALADPASVAGLLVQAMRRVLTDHARRRRAAKRPDARQRVALDDAPLMVARDPDTFLAIDRLLERLAQGEGERRRIRHAPRIARVAQLAWYLGLTEAEIAEHLALSKSTVGRDIRFARCWLRARLEDADGAAR